MLRSLITIALACCAFLASAQVPSTLLIRAPHVDSLIHVLGIHRI
jgi:hypothetical protein